MSSITGGVGEGVFRLMIMCEYIVCFKAVLALQCVCTFTLLNIHHHHHQHRLCTVPIPIYFLMRNIQSFYSTALVLYTFIAHTNSLDKNVDFLMDSVVNVIKKNHN